MGIHVQQNAQRQDYYSTTFFMLSRKPGSAGPLAGIVWSVNHHRPCFAQDEFVSTPVVNSGKEVLDPIHLFLTYERRLGDAPRDALSLFMLRPLLNAKVANITEYSPLFATLQFAGGQNVMSVGCGRIDAEDQAL